mgnify:CR=1 FL=1
MRVGDSKRPNERLVKGEKYKHAVSVVHSPFFDTLHEQTVAQLDFDDALANIGQLGERLRRQPTLINLKNYKAAVKAFLQIAIKASYGVTEQRFIDRYGRRRLFLVITRVNEKLEELTRMVLSEQSPNIDLAAKLDEIRGLLLDIIS